MGETNLQSVDLAAHQTVVESEPFQQVFLSQTAESLRHRFSNAISPIIHGELSSDKRVSFEAGLESVFRFALMIKMHALAARGSFEVVWPKSGSPFDRRCMKERLPETIEGDREESETRSRTVSLVVTPGLHVRQRYNGLVDYSGFTMHNGETLQETSPVAPAVVITE